MLHVDILIPYAQSEIVSLIHENGILDLEEHTNDGTHIVGWVPIKLAGRIAGFHSNESAA